jgi:hypothetical protein
MVWSARSSVWPRLPTPTPSHECAGRAASASAPLALIDTGVPMLTASMRRRSAWACSAAPIDFGAAPARACSSTPVCGSLFGPCAIARTRPCTST